MAELDRTAIEALVRPLRVRPGRKVRLPEDHDPADTGGIAEGAVADLLRRSVELLSEYQARLAAQDTYGLLVILQALDAAGKDGTIKHVMSGVNPQGVSVHSFKEPTPEELDHDYLWRAAKALPARGQIGIFNRSYYEEVLIARVHPAMLDAERLPPEAKGTGVWARRFREIDDWERYLVDNGFRIVKLFLNVSKEEQRRRFLARIDEPHKNWKFRPEDAQERGFWDGYQAAYSELLTHTSTDFAPWHVIPADHKWFAHIAAAAVILDALISIDPRYPVLGEAEREALLEAKANLEADAPEGATREPAEREPAEREPGEHEPGEHEPDEREPAELDDATGQATASTGSRPNAEAGSAERTPAEGMSARADPKARGGHRGGKKKGRRSKG